MSLETELKEYARQVGFDVVAIGPAKPYVRAARELYRRRKRGHHPPFTVADIALRCDPRRLLPSARSVIALGVSYLTPHRSRASRSGREPRGQISRYAWGEDYHRVMRRRMELIVSFLERRAGAGVQAQAFVDTGPPVDREVAAEAGLGWFGKNACLYVPNYGSWVFLGEIFTNLDLAPDPRVTLDCGDCDRCIRACPTGAITEAYYVDPNRCVSYLTQMPGSIPEELRESIGLRVFGCDVCQDVCPWNREAVCADRPEFRPRPEVGTAPSLIDMLRMTKGQFRQKFGLTAAGWRGKKTLQRNAAIALGNSRNPEAVPALAEALSSDPKPVVRASAAWALGRIGGQAAAAALREARGREADPEVRQEIERALERLADPERAGAVTAASPATPGPPPPPAAHPEASRAGE
ncbi:MAG: tRNA epoxyqueuosine(34) reductase QueG [Firmicutes bacterium]|nr:tRNA epoxyqueuosine(34) reductase QueG [Bacillota bacterium]